ncbi:MAG: HlyD family efflux transporter periplasmic adaptor subunit [Rubripirellula sp.]|nr:HlyD family efflux transporter periplasmic adaptor subunit [Rubripirellula sp.]
MRFTLSMLYLVIAAATPVLAQQALAPQAAVGSAQDNVENCVVQYIKKVEVPARAEGTLTDLKVEEGVTVSQGQVLAVIDDTVAKINIELKKAEEKEALLNATNEVNLNDAKNSEELARAEAEAYEELRRERAIPYWELEKKKLEAVRALLRIDLAEMQKKIAMVQAIAKGNELDLANYELDRRQVKAPWDGFIEARRAQLGEWVQPGTPILTLIQMDKLRVEGDIDALASRKIVHGAKVEVTIYDKDSNATSDSKPIEGTLGYVSMEIDLNNRHRVWVEIENVKDDGVWRYKPGMKAKILIP